MNCIYVLACKQRTPNDRERTSHHVSFITYRNEWRIRPRTQYYVPDERVETSERASERDGDPRKYYPLLGDSVPKYNTHKKS